MTTSNLSRFKDLDLHFSVIVFLQYFQCFTFHISECLFSPFTLVIVCFISSLSIVIIIASIVIQDKVSNDMQYLSSLFYSVGGVRSVDRDTDDILSCRFELTGLIHAFTYQHELSSSQLKNDCHKHISF